MKPQIPTQFFQAYLSGRRAWIRDGKHARCPFSGVVSQYWQDGFDDARLGYPDRYVKGE